MKDETDKPLVSRTHARLDVFPASCSPASSKSRTCPISCRDFLTLSHVAWSTLHRVLQAQPSSKGIFANMFTPVIGLRWPPTRSIAFPAASSPYHITYLRTRTLATTLFPSKHDITHCQNRFPKLNLGPKINTKEPTCRKKNTLFPAPKPVQATWGTS